jgi:alpha-glucosidase
MRPTFYDYPQMQGASCDQSIAFTVGRDLLVAASPKPDSPEPYEICLPSKGWYEYWTGVQLPGDKSLETPHLDYLPVFVRPGAIIPRQPLVQSTSETPKGPLSLEVYPGDDCRGEIYLDDGISIHGPSLRQAITCTVAQDGVTLHFGPREGAFRPWWTQIAITVNGDRRGRRLIPDQPGPATIQIPTR